VNNLTIGTGGTLDIRGTGFTVYGQTVINNGLIQGDTLNSTLAFLGPDPVYSGSGSIEGLVWNIFLKCNTLTLDSLNGIRLREISIDGCMVINSNKVTIGNNDSVDSWIRFGDSSGIPGGFDTAPVFELGTGLENLRYAGNVARSTGVEVNPERKVGFLQIESGSPAEYELTISGGDLRVSYLYLVWGVINTGPNKIVHHGNLFRQSGWVEGTLVREFTAPAIYKFHVGQNGYSPVSVTAVAVGVNPSSLSIRTVDTTLPGLLPANSASRYWELVETGDLTASMTFNYLDADVRGSEPDYVLWFSNGGQPVVTGSTTQPNSNTVSTASGTTFFTGNWGIGGQLDPGPVSISGSVTTAGGQPIRNARLTISGGNLPAPAEVQTGNFGTYSFGNLQAGEAYAIRVDVKRYRFSQTTQIVTPMGNVSNVNFIANPQE
jgi:hypothetical protein